MNIVAAFDPNFGSLLNLISESGKSLPLIKRVANHFMRYKHHISLMGSVFLTEQLLFIYKVAVYFQNQEIIW